MVVQGSRTRGIMHNTLEAYVQDWSGPRVPFIQLLAPVPFRRGGIVIERDVVYGDRDTLAPLRDAREFAAALGEELALDRALRGAEGRPARVRRSLSASLPQSFSAIRVPGFSTEPISWWSTRVASSPSIRTERHAAPHGERENERSAVTIGSSPGHAGVARRSGASRKFFPSRHAVLRAPVPAYDATTVPFLGGRFGSGERYGACWR